MCCWKRFCVMFRRWWCWRLSLRGCVRRKFGIMWLLVNLMFVWNRFVFSVIWIGWCICLVFCCCWFCWYCLWCGGVRVCRLWILMFFEFGGFLVFLVKLKNDWWCVWVYLGLGFWILIWILIGSFCLMNIVCCLRWVLKVCWDCFLRISVNLYLVWLVFCVWWWLKSCLMCSNKLIFLFFWGKLSRLFRCCVIIWLRVRSLVYWFIWICLSFIISLIVVMIMKCCVKSLIVFLMLVCCYLISILMKVVVWKFMRWCLVVFRCCGLVLRCWKWLSSWFLKSIMTWKLRFLIWKFIVNCCCCMWLLRKWFSMIWNYLNLLMVFSI